jgi:hypothetical protein
LVVVASVTGVVGCAHLTVKDVGSAVH